MPISEGTGRGAPLLNAGVPVDGTDEVQTITPSAAVASGNWRIRFQGCVTATLAHNVSAANLQTALRALPTIGALGCTVGLNAGVYTVTFGGGNMAKLALPMLEVVYNTVKDAGNADVTWTVAESVAGVSATYRGAPKGALLLDTTNGNLYVNTGTALAPTWLALPYLSGLTASVAELNITDGVTKTSAQINALVAGAAGGYKIARGQATTVAASDDIDTGLATVVAIMASLDDDPVDGCMFATASIGNQGGAPAAGHAYIKTWKCTDADSTLIAATTFGKKVNWVALGT